MGDKMQETWKIKQKKTYNHQGRIPLGYDIYLTFTKETSGYQWAIWYQQRGRNALERKLYSL